MIHLVAHSTGNSLHRVKIKIRFIDIDLGVAGKPVEAIREGACPAGLPLGVLVSAVLVGIGQHMTSLRRPSTPAVPNGLIKILEGVHIMMKKEAFAILPMLGHETAGIYSKESIDRIVL